MQRMLAIAVLLAACDDGSSAGEESTSDQQETFTPLESSSGDSLGESSSGGEVALTAYVECDEKTPCEFADGQGQTRCVSNTCTMIVDSSESGSVGPSDRCPTEAGHDVIDVPSTHHDYRVCALAADVDDAGLGHCPSGMTLAHTVFLGDPQTSYATCWWNADVNSGDACSDQQPCEGQADCIHQAGDDEQLLYSVCVPF